MSVATVTSSQWHHHDAYHPLILVVYLVAVNLVVWQQPLVLGWQHLQQLMVRPLVMLVCLDSHQLYRLHLDDAYLHAMDCHTYIAQSHDE